MVGLFIMERGTFHIYFVYGKLQTREEIEYLENEGRVRLFSLKLERKDSKFPRDNNPRLDKNVGVEGLRTVLIRRSNLSRKKQDRVSSKPIRVEIQSTRLLYRHWEEILF